ncbi:hypothetical protein [Streptomyces sp. NPDC001410]|uniref:hypothetical protein n=1 Tax=Streptomyces sp. NPDC001410 TaxID=3364574 RepID=UPI0036A516B5
MTRIRRALRRLIDHLFPSQPHAPLVMGPDWGDDEEWSGGGFIWEPGDLDNDEGASR